jgi:hypothetical protein
MGKKFKCLGCDVFFLLADLLKDYTDNFFTKLAKKAGNKTVVLFIDEVQNNPTSATWDELSKSPRPANLLVLGVGLVRLFNSPQFDEKFQKQGELFPMFLTDRDLPESFRSFQE